MEELELEPVIWFKQSLFWVTIIEIATALKEKALNIPAHPGMDNFSASNG
jgi:hypothetical protein